LNATALFGADVLNTTERLLNALTEHQCGIDVGQWTDYLHKNTAYFNEYVPNRLQNVSAALDSLPGRVNNLTLNIVKEFKNGFTGPNGMFTALMKLLKNVWPAADQFSVKGIVQVSNMLQNVFLWGISYWATCMSISAHFLIIGQVFIVIGLWVRRRGQLRGNGNWSDSLGSLSGSSGDNLIIVFYRFLFVRTTTYG
jgi:hypothetical protein